MAWSKLDTINLALTWLNKASVNDLTNSGVFADSASRAFDILYNTCISAKAWRFATKIELLNVLPEEPPIARWRYMLQLPSDYQAAVRIYPNTAYQIYSDQVIYCNLNVVSLEYRFIPDITACPGYFIQYLAMELVVWYANAVAQNDSLAARAEGWKNTAMQNALFADAQSRPNDAITNNPIIQSRFGGWYSDYDVAGNPNV